MSWSMVPPNNNKGAHSSCENLQGKVSTNIFYFTELVIAAFPDGTRSVLGTVLLP